MQASPIEEKIVRLWVRSAGPGILCFEELAWHRLCPAATRNIGKAEPGPAGPFPTPQPLSALMAGVGER